MAGIMEIFSAISRNITQPKSSPSPFLAQNNKKHLPRSILCPIHPFNSRIPLREEEEEKKKEERASRERPLLLRRRRYPSRKHSRFRAFIPGMPCKTANLKFRCPNWPLRNLGAAKTSRSERVESSGEIADLRVNATRANGAENGKYRKGRECSDRIHLLH